MAGHLVAAAYTAAGWSVLPITPGQKYPPLLSSWKPYQGRIATLDEIREWWTRTPDANVAIVTGAVSGLSVIDVDDDAGGTASLREAGIRFPKTRVHKTPRGFHLFYRYTPELHTGAGFLPGIDCRSDGGYVVAPPSHTEAGTYTVFRDLPVGALDPIPTQFLSHARSTPGPTAPAPTPHREPDWVATALRGAPEHQRNATATRLIGYFHRKGVPRSAIWQIMAGQFARNCNPPMDERELDRTIDSVTRLEGGVGGQGGAGYVDGLWNHQR